MPVSVEGEVYFRIGAENVRFEDAEWAKLEPILIKKSPEWLLSMVEIAQAKLKAREVTRHEARLELFREIHALTYQGLGYDGVILAIGEMYGKEDEGCLSQPASNAKDFTGR